MATKISKMKYIENIKKKWDSVIEEYVYKCYDAIETNKHESDPDFIQRLHETFKDIVMYFFILGNYKDRLLVYPPRHNQIIWGQFVHLQSEKMKTDFFFGLDYDGFALSSSLENATHIHSMKDDFWNTLSSLSVFGSLKWEKNISPSSEQYVQCSKILSRCNSNILKFACSYLFQELEQLQEREHNYIDMGNIEIKWEPDIPLDRIISYGSKTFHALYQLNYMLFKSEYLKKRRYNKRENSKI